MGKLKSVEHRFKSTLFWMLRAFLKKARTGLPPLDGNSCRKVLFLRPEKIGDMVISLPVFDALKRRFPHIRIAVLGSPRNYSLIREDPRFDRVFLYRKHLLKDVRMLLALRRERFDCVLDMINDDSVTTLFISQLASPDAVRIGIGKRRHSPYYDFNHDHADGIGGHIIDNTLKLLLPFGIDGEQTNRYAPPFIPARAQAAVDDFLGTIASNGDETMVGFNISAGRPNRIWSLQKAEKLSRRLIQTPNNMHLIIIAAPTDRQRGEKLLSRLEGAARLVPPGLSLPEISALISRLDLLISPDTSLIHIARSFKVPVVGLYSRARKNFQRWQPFDQPDGAIVAHNDDDIFDITVNQVYSRAVEVLKGRKRVAF